MNLNNKKLDNLISRALKETLEDRTTELESKLNINELGGMEDEHPVFGKENLSKMSRKEMSRFMKKHYGKGFDDEDDEEEEDDDFSVKKRYVLKKDKDEKEGDKEEMEEGFDDFGMKKYRMDKDYSKKEFEDFPIGRGDAYFDEELYDDLTGISFDRYSKRNRRRDDDYGDDEGGELVAGQEEFTEGKDMTCECGGMMKEGMCSECGYKMEGISDVDDINNEENDFDYVAEDIDFEDDSNAIQIDDEAQREMCKKLSRKEAEVRNCSQYLDDEEMGEMTEKLHGNQRRLDKNKNGKLDSADFKMLRAMKGKKQETDEEVEEGNAFTGALAKAKKEGDDEFTVGGKKFHVRESKESKKCKICGMRNCKCKHKKDMKEKWEGDVEVKQTGEYSDMSIEELNSAIKKLKSKNEKAKESGKKVSQSDRTKMSQLYFAKRAKQGWKGKGKAAVKESVQLTESQLIELIEGVILEQKLKYQSTSGTPKGLQKYKQSHEKSGKENKDYLKSVTKKMKDYLKDGSKGDYDMEPKMFPKGNGELAKMKKKAYIPSDAIKDYTDNLTAAGLENLDYDEIHPNEDWVDKNVEGSSMTGNNPKWANAVDTGVNKKRNKVRKDNLLAKIKRKAYNKAPQPVVSDKTGEDLGSKLMMKLESKQQKEEQKLNEEFDRMKGLIDYNRKTQ